MAFEPNTTIYIGTVPFDQSYKHVRLYPDRATQQSSIAAMCPQVLRRSDYTYQRPSNSLVVPFNAESLYQYNYAMFQNANYGDRWFYSFITDIEYIGESQSRLYLETDVMQTWFLDCSVNPCLVEREHVNNDAIGVNVKNEGIDPGTLVLQSSQARMQASWVPVVASTVEPLSDGTYVNNQGDVYGNVYSGASRTVFWGANALANFKDFMLALSNNGQQDAISEAYMVPEWMVSWGGESRIVDKSNGFGYWLRNGTSSVAATRNLDFTISFSDCNGYVPKNNKLFTFPFSKIVVTTVTDQQELMCELFSNVKGAGLGSSATLTFYERAGWEPDASSFCYPAGYADYGGDGFENAVSLPAWPTVSYVYQSFANMYGGGFGEKLSAGIQNTQASYATSYTNNQLSTTLGMASGAVSGAAMGASIGSAIPGVGTAIGAAVGATAGAATALAGGLTNSASITQAKENSLRSAKADLSAAGLVPNTVKGKVSSSAEAINSGLFGYYFRLFRVRPEIAKMIDDYFSVYGYSVAEVKSPNITGRRSWNYVKTNGCNVLGNVPSAARTMINAMIDGGVTFWHTDSVGNYSLNNAII